LTSAHEPDPPNKASNPRPEFSSFVGLARYVGNPVQYTDATDSFWAAGLQCTAVHRSDWGNYSPLHVYGALVVPSSVYSVQDLPQTSGKPGPLIGIKTARWGDVGAPFQATCANQQPACTPCVSSCATQPDFSDISEVLNAFKNVASAYSARPFARLQPNIPDPIIEVNFLDISACVDAFKNLAYPFTYLAACPQ
jgi:hypothetical protein